jgi:uncharacterized membrane protein YgcG
MKVISFIAAAAFGLALAGCSNDYLERKDTVTFSAGDAVAWNAAQQIPDPWPKGVNNTRIVADGDKAARAVRRDRNGQDQWIVDKDDSTKLIYLPPDPASVGNSGGGGGAGGGGPGAGGGGLGGGGGGQ